MITISFMSSDKFKKKSRVVFLLSQNNFFDVLSFAYILIRLYLLLFLCDQVLNIPHQIFFANYDRMDFVCHFLIRLQCLLKNLLVFHNYK